MPLKSELIEILILSVSFVLLNGIFDSIKSQCSDIIYNYFEENEVTSTRVASTSNFLLECFKKVCSLFLKRIEELINGSEKVILELPIETFLTSMKILSTIIAGVGEKTEININVFYYILNTVHKKYLKYTNIVALSSLQKALESDMWNQVNVDSRIRKLIEIINEPEKRLSTLGSFKDDKTISEWLEYEQTKYALSSSILVLINCLYSHVLFVTYFPANALDIVQNTCEVLRVYMISFTIQRCAN